MPYELGTIWNVTSKYIYNTLDKNIGIGTTTPICELDVYCNIAENGIKLEDKYQLKPENNKKYDLIVREDLDEDHQHLIIWYKFNKDDFTSNFTSNNDTVGQQYGELSNERGTISNLQKEYYVGTGSAEINDELYYKIEMTNNQFNSGEYTFCFWLFLNEECDNYKYILNLQDKGSSTESDIFYLKYFTGKLKIYKDPNNYIEYNYTLDINKWHHITIIINDPASLDILIDGILIDDIYTSQQTNGFLRNGSEEREKSANIYLGNISNSIDGYIDDFRIYKTNLQINYIQNNIIGKITKITPGNISANGNYGIDIVNYSSNVNIGGTGPNDNVNLRVFGNLTVDGDLSISELVIDTSRFNTLNITSNLTVGSNVDIDNDLTVSRTITENQRTLAQKYASISQIDKHTDVIISKMTDKDDVEALYTNMPQFFQSNLILAYDFDFNIYNIDNSNDFFSNNVLQLNTNTAPIYSTFSEYSIVPNRSKNAIDYYGTKYVKGNSSLHCGSNIFNSGGIDYYSFNTQDINSAYLTSSKSYTISFWIRFNEIDRNQYIFNFGVPVNPVDPIEKSINISLNSSNNLNIDIVNRNRGAPVIPNSIETFKFKKDEWYHIVLILKNGINILIPTDINTDSNLLIQYFLDLGYTNNTSPTPTHFDFAPATNIATIFTYVNGIELDEKTYSGGVSIFGNNPATFINYFGVLNSASTTDYLNGYIDDFKMYRTVVPINYINENIIGDALIIKPGLLSAIGNYGINIKNFEKIVSVGDCNNDVDLHIYGLLKIEETKLTISNCDIDNLNGILTTSNFEILETLDVSNITVSNIEIYDLISGPDFHLGSSNFISNIKIDHLSNINLNSCNITADTITVNNELILGDAILSNIKIYGINIDDTFSISNNNITIRSDLTIGDTNCNAYRYDLGTVNFGTRRRITDDDSNFSDYNGTYDPDFTTIIPTDDIDIQIFNNSIIFYGNTDQQHYDIYFKNNYIRNENCNIKDEIEKSYGEDRDRTRIKLDVGNIKLQNGFIELEHIDILEDNLPLSTLKIEENQISITSNVNTTILNDSLMLSNNENYCNCLLTNSNFMFNNGNGFTDAETLKINTIEITEELAITKINTGNSNHNTISIDTSNASIIGKIRGHLCSNSIIDITDEIKTTSNITASNITASNITITDTLYTSNIICDYEITFKDDGTTNCNTIIRQDSIDVHQLHIYGGITLGQQTGSADNSIEGSFGSLNIRTIKTTNSNSAEISIDTFHLDKLGKIRGFLYSNSEINITGLIETSSNIIGIDITASNLYASNIRGNPGDDLCSIIGKLESNSVINISGLIETSSNIIASNITITDTLDVSNITVSNILISDSVFGTYLTASNILYASNIQGIPGDDLCSIIGRLENDSIIDINCNITTTQDIHSLNQFTSNTLFVSNIRGIDGDDLCSIIGKLESDSVINISGLIETSSNIIASNITINDTLYASNIRVSNILISDSVFGTYLTASNILYASNIQGIDGVPCSIIGRLENDSIININCNITTTQDIHSLNQFTSNTLFVSNIQGIPGDDLCSIIGKLESNSIINISGEIKTSSNITANNITINDTLDVSNITDSSTNDYFITSSNSGIFVNKIRTNNTIDGVYSIDTLVGNTYGKIRAKLADNSEIDITCNITTTANIKADILFINTITTNSSEINITPTLKCDSIELNTINSDFEILRALNVLNDRANRSGTYTGVELLNDHIKWYDETAESYIKINNTGLFSKAGKNKDVEYEIISYNDANDIKIKCDILEVASFDVGDGSKFSFPNIIDYSKSTATNTETNETYNIPNVYIGDDKTFANINETLDVLYVDTPYTTRLNTGNLLVRDILEISPDSSKSSAINSMKIFTGNINTSSGSREADIITSPFTNFTNQNGDTIISCSLDTNSVGINTQPGITDDDIKLYIEGGIQCSKDIVAFANVSDKRFKTNITSFDINDIDIVNKLNPVRFIWKDNLFNSNMANKPDIGFIAQEVKEVIPEAVSVCKIEMNNIDYNYIKYERIIPYLVNNIKYLNNKIVELENKLNGV